MKDGQLAQVLKFVVLEDHPLVRSAIIRDVLHRLGKVQVLYEGASLAEALDTARTTDVDCAVLDLDLGDGTNPADNVRALVDVGVPVLVISALADPMVVRESMSAGALAYVSKQADADVMQEAIQSTLAGKPFMSPDIALAIISDLQAEVKLSGAPRAVAIRLRTENDDRRSTHGRVSNNRSGIHQTGSCEIHQSRTGCLYENGPIPHCQETWAHY